MTINTAWWGSLPTWGHAVVFFFYGFGSAFGGLKIIIIIIMAKQRSDRQSTGDEY